MAPTAPRPRRTADLLLGALALLALAALLAGVPAALIAAVGDPLPHHLPAGSDLTTALTPQEITKGLALLLWLLWLQFAAAVAAELAARRGARRLHLPAASATQALARRLIATAFLLGTAATALPTAQAATAPAAPPPAAAAYAIITPAHPAAAATTPASAPSAIPGIPASAPYIQIEQHDTLWRLAEQHLGDGARYTEIFELNQDRPQPDGSALTHAALIQPGWALIMPDDATGCPRAPAAGPAAAHEVTVTPGDSLWAEAQRAYGDGAAYPAIFRASQAITQPDGRHLTDPSAINVGWHLIIPAAPAASTPSAARPGHDPAPTIPTTATPAPAAPAPSTPAPSPADPAPASPAPASSAPTTPQSAPTAADPATTAPANSRPSPTAASGSRALWEILGVGALLAATAIALLDRHRRRQQRARRLGESIRMPAPAPTALERLLRAGADHDSADFADRALRTLADNARATGADLPDLHLAMLDDTGLYLQPATPAPALPPFTCTDDPAWWICPRDATLDAPDIPAPYPTLSTVGHDEYGRAILVDLESARALELTGPRSLDALRALALDLLGSEHRDDTAVTLVGFGLELAELDLPGQLHLAADLDSALDTLTGWAHAAEEALSACGAATVRSARLHTAADMLTPHILITAQAPAGAAADRLARLLAQAPAMCAAVLGGAALPLHPPPLTLAATGAAAPLMPHDFPVTAQYLADADYHTLIDHLRTRLESVPEAAWTPPTAAADDPPPADCGPQPPTEPPTPEPWQEAHGWDEPADPTPEPTDPDAASPPEPAAGHIHPQVRVLGPVDLVHPRGSVEPTRRSRLIELAAYLVLHPGGDHHAVTEAVWPRGTTLTNRNTAVSKLRGWLGRDDDGRPYLPAVGSAGYRLAPMVDCDWHRFQKLTRRAAARGSAGAEDLQAALELVRGTPFAGTPPTRYSWADWPRQEMSSRIADVAFQLSEIHLQAGAWDGARAAATRGLVAAPESERLYRQLFKAALHAGDLAELERLAIVLQARTEELGVDLERETVELLDELLAWRVSARAAM